LAGLAIAALLTVGSTFPGFAEDAPKTPPADTPAATTAAPADTTPGVAPRPSLLSRKNNPSAAGPKADEPRTAEQPAADAPPLRHRRHYAHRHHRYWGNYRYAYWEPFPIFFPHIYHNRIHWNRDAWMCRFSGCWCPERGAARSAAPQSRDPKPRNRPRISSAPRRGR